jgi:hypothetical protein
MFATSLLFYQVELGVRIMASLSHAAEFAFGKRFEVSERVSSLQASRFN